MVRTESERRLPPAPLLFLLLATLVVGCAWALLVPAFQAPDENAHVAYVQSLAERGALPGNEGEAQSTEQRAAADAANADQTAQVVDIKPEWSERAHDRWLARSRMLGADARADGGGPNPASPNPPLYYLAEVLPYEAASGGDLFARLTAMRLTGVVFLLITVLATWLTAGAVFGPNRLLQLSAAAVPALLPMVTFVSTSVSPDTLLYAFWSLALWLGSRLVLGRGTTRDVVAIAVVAGLALLTKATSYALLPAVGFALVVAAVRSGYARRRIAATLAIGAAAFALVVAPWYVIARIDDRPATGQLAGAGSSEVDVREFGSYVWQFYLPRLPVQARYGALGRYPQAYETWFKQGTAAFGWLETRWPDWLYRILFAIPVLVLAGAAVTLVRQRRRVDPMLLVFFGVAAVVLLAGLHWNEYRLAEASGVLSNQGRYLFPLISLAGLAVAAAVRALPQTWRAPAVGAALGGLAVMQIFALALVAQRFYA